MVNGDSLVLAQDLGPGAGADCDTPPFPTVAARFGFELGTWGNRRLRPNQVLFIWGHGVLDFLGQCQFLQM